MFSARRLSPFVLSLFFSLAAFAVSPAQGATTVGTLPGSFGVTPSGAATYNIPIGVPKGAGALTPQLALVYSSQSGSGMAGWGWTLSGFSDITRCNSAIYDDGQGQAVQLVANDDYCLDGQRLRLISGTYGGSGTYGTEIEGFSLITSYVDSGVTGGPGHFTVTTKDGTTYEYGNTSDSRVLAQGTSVARLWALDRITDVNGSYISFTYQQDTTAGDYWPLTINYTGNGGTAPTHQVQLDWVQRAPADTQTSYVAGSQVSETQLLHDIKVNYNGSTTFTYTLAYITDSATSRSLLSTVQECNTVDGNCFPATSIAWQQGTAGWQTAVNTSATVASAALAQAAHLMDVNGDGIADLVYPNTAGSTTDWWVMFGQAGGGFGTPVDTGIAANNYATALELDFNGDGRADLIYSAGDNTWHVLQSLGGTTTNNIFQDKPTGISNTAATGGFTVADLNGHGLGDIVYTDGSTLYAALNTGGAYSAATTLVPSQSSTLQELGVSTTSTFNQFVDASMDFVGSGRGGRVELNGVNTTTTCGPDSGFGCQPTSNTSWNFYSLAPAGTSTNLSYNVSAAVSLGTQSGEAPPSGWSNPIPLDMNGDGLTDLMTAQTPTGGAYVIYTLHLSTGASLPGELTVDGVVGSEPLFADYNGNGRQAMLVNAYQQSTCGGAAPYWCLLSLNYDPSQHAYVTQSTSLSSAPYPSTYVPGTLRIGDIGGRGMDDLVYLGNDSGTLNWHYAQHAGSKPDLVSGITDGLGNNYSPAYVSLANSSGAYTKGSSAQYPVIETQPALYVANTYSFNDGTGGTATESYSYQGLQVNMTGLSLGFAQRTATDNRNGVSVLDNYDHGFPYIGLVDSETTSYKPSGTPVTLGTTVNTYQDSISNSPRHFPYVASSVLTVNDINSGVVLKTITSSNKSLDGYGDVTDQLVDTHDNTALVDFTAETVTSYADSTSPYCINASLTSTVTRTTPGGTMQRKSDASLSFDTTHCRPTQVTASAGTDSATGVSTTDNLSATTAYQYDSWGNVSQTTVTGTGIASRSSSVVYTNNGEYPGTLTNALGQVAYETWRSDLGFETTATDINGHQTTNTPDGFGRMKQVSHPDGTATSWQYLPCDSTCQRNTGSNVGSYMITASVTNAGGTQTINAETTDYDIKGRAIQSYKTLLGGNPSISSSYYDSLGRVTQAVTPYLPGAATLYSTYYSNYDVLNRPGKITQPVTGTDTGNNLVTTFSYPNYNGTYSGFASVVTQADNIAGTSQTTAQVNDALGETTTMVDANGGTTNYSYDPYGDLVSVTAADNKITSLGYDGLGNKLQMSDPDMGTWSYSYDALGELLCQTDARQISIIQQYDLAGRVKSRLETAVGAGCSAVTGTLTDNWTYDTSTNGKGMPAAVSDSTGYSKAFSYDSLSRPSALDTTVSGTDYQVSTTYDSFGRTATLSYPASATPAPPLPVARATATPSSVVGGGTVTLDGSTSTDPNGDPLQFAWSQTAGSSVSIANPTAKTTSVSLSQGGSYTFQLVVRDSNAESNPVTVTAQVTTPASPTGVGLSPNPSLNGNYTLSWTAPGGGVGVTGYYVYESVNNGAFNKIATLTATSYALSGKTNGSYAYYVIAYNAVGNGPASSTVTESVTFPPGVPGTPSISGPNPSTNGSYTVSWTAPSGTTTAYEIFRSTGGAYTQIATVTSTSYAVTGQGNGSYWYYVIACNQTACGGNTPAAAITVLLTPGVPSLSPSSAQVAVNVQYTLSWTVPSGTVTSYQLQTSENSLSFPAPPTGVVYNGSGTSYSTSKSPGGNDWYYQVRACNSNGANCSAWSGVADIYITCTRCNNAVKAPTSSPPPSTSSGPLGAVTPVLDSIQEGEGGAKLAAFNVSTTPVARQDNATAARALAVPAATDALRTSAVLAELNTERLGLAPARLQAPEADLQAAATRREEARLSVIAPPVAASDLAAWERTSAGHDPKGPDYAPPAYIAYGGAVIKPATNPPYRFTLQYGYDAGSGALVSVQDANTGFAYWQADTGSGVAPVDGFGHLLAYTDGNNVSTVLVYDQATAAVNVISTGIGQSTAVQALTYTWDGFGNLKQRKDLNQNLSESFTYDVLNRLKTSAVANPGNNGPSLTLTYDVIGNISSRSDLGAYTYDTNHPRAVSTVAGLPGTYTYDANGNMLTGPNGRSVTWNADNLPTQIQSGGNTSTFSYGPSHERYFQSATDSSGTTTTTYIAGGLFEVVANSAGTQFRHNVMAGGQAIAVHTITAAGVVSTSYLHSDHLGSVDTLTIEQGTVAQRMSFDTFGKRRDATNWTYDLTGTQIAGLKSSTDRGYTDQEQLDDVGLVHMNGRVYDPIIGRMISADPTMPDRGYSQSFNRYAYVYNNPLVMIDKSGFDGAVPNAPLAELGVLHMINGLTGLLSGVPITGIGMESIVAGGLTSESGVGLAFIAAGAPVAAEGLDVTAAAEIDSVQGAEELYSGAFGDGSIPTDWGAEQFGQDASTLISGLSLVHDLLKLPENTILNKLAEEALKIAAANATSQSRAPGSKKTPGGNKPDVGRGGNNNRGAANVDPNTQFQQGLNQLCGEVRCTGDLFINCGPMLGGGTWCFPQQSGRAIRTGDLGDSVGAGTSPDVSTSSAGGDEPIKVPSAPTADPAQN